MDNTNNSKGNGKWLTTAALVVTLAAAGGAFAYGPMMGMHDDDDMPMAQGYGYGYRMVGGYGMGPGMMGGYGIGPGMMGGYGMGPGMMGGYGMGPGMMGGYGMGPGMMGGYGMGPAGYGLNLSPEQQEKIAGIQEQARKEQYKRMGEMMEAMESMRGEMLKDEPSPDAVAKAYDKVSAQWREMLKARIKTQNEVRAVLTKEQREQLRGMAGPGMGMIW